MPDDTQQPAAPAGSAAAQPPAPPRPTGKLAFTLVVIMLAALCLLVILLLVIPDVTNATQIEYYKSAFTALVGTFGAWIGAGAAYFFGRENLTESSISTEKALTIQSNALGGALRKQRIKDLHLTPINSMFLFNPDSTKDEVLKGLEQHVDYWWVPVVDPKTGSLVDVLHARVFWAPAVKAAKVSQIISDLDSLTDLKSLTSLHGGTFFIKVSPDTVVADVEAAMTKANAAVGVVVGDKDKPIYCFTRQDISSVPN